jgi:adenine-specific DNA methylase
MVNSYSMNPTDSLRFKEELKNLSAYGVVTYTNAGRLNAEIENKFCKNQNICFNDLYETTDIVYNKVKQVKIPV